MNMWVQTAGLIATTSAALAGLLFMGKQTRNGWRRMRSLAGKIERVFELADRELAANHGSSIKDQVTKTSTDLAEVRTEVAALCKWMDRYDQRFIELNRRVGQLEGRGFSDAQ